ncbi:TetR/AcrR family transcriptional regulator [Flavobacterium sp. FlaQc-52]|jgi:TetR/AcrR family transcriptional repressor of nem operon|uniref:TetR/AcrR family transcriptional regulator n=1 Tax=Flavobacterium cupriresistens TaxID=2893885 RepID=A0ABU4RBB2_9FLAO|nr:MULTISPECIES: TetR/AcrR family transcriptional regulator [unclassified Flavobacterium]MDX6189288.1 TetR/AcrR family transcriptional regulator [Flavobacterium sp. Fl-318]UFH41384.1 TetR/AcrR family transcriptional regulator [Flavobacterium sp. F-323]
MLTKAERTKQFILETAAPIFNQKGIAGASIDDVLEAAKLTKGCLYGHFESKEDLSIQVVNYMLDYNGLRLVAAINKAKTAKTKVFAYLDFYKDPLETNIKGGCPVFNMAVESDDTFPIIKERVAGVIRNGQDLFVEILNKGILDGEFTNKLEPEIYAFKAVAAVEGALVLCRTMNTAKPMQGLIKNLKEELEQFVI